MQRVENKIDDTINIEYERPKTTSRIYASIIDYLLLLVVTFCLIWASDAINKSTDNYKYLYETQSSIRFDSGLYVGLDSNDLVITNDGNYDFNKIKKVQLITTYYTLNNTNMATQLKIKLRDGLYKFISFGESVDSNSDKYGNYETTINGVTYKFGELQKHDFNDYLKSKAVNGLDLFTYNEQTKLYEENSDAITKVDANEYINIYTNYIKNYASSNLSMIPLFFNCSQNLFVLMVVIIISSLLAGLILIFYIPGLIFYRGRRSFGKLIFKIGLVNKEYYNLSFLTYTLRFLLILLETITFIPAVISFTMMVFSKKQHTIHDLVLKTNAIDLFETKIYKDEMEAYIDKTKGRDKVDFNSL